ncbi:MAG: TonB-dependent receptor, partial [Gammaproteobacteria bacterium]|nr:TonB-dependent receptor [Gammaproteobacteria bacterium]
MHHRTSRLRALRDSRLRSAGVAGLAAILLLGLPGSITLAADAGSTATGPSKDHGKDLSQEELQPILVTGSLIPQVVEQTATPVTVISAMDIQTKGFATVADALQHSSFATGAVQGPQFSNGFTPGAQTLSLFGLSPSYTKYLIDGRPIADYPALYNGTDIITSITGIPTQLVDHIDVLPGGQSSIYGSDAIAGVVNIVLLKHVKGPEIDARYGWTKGGGGTERRIGLIDEFHLHGIDLLAGGQYERTDPVWGFQRPLTNQFFSGGGAASPAIAERDWLVYGLFGQPNGDLYYMNDPAQCANVANQFGGSVGLRTRAARGQYCGTFRSGWFTINNGTEATQGFLRASDDLNDHVKLFSDLLVDHDVTRYNPGTAFFSTADNSSGPYNYFYDPNYPNDFLNLQQIYSPEEAGNVRGQDDKNTMNSVRATVGARGALWSPDWQYTLDFTYTENRLTEATHLAFTNAINQFYAPIFGPNLGPDPIFGSQPTYTVNYGAFFQPITPAQYASFTGYADSYSRTEDSLARAQLTNSSLFRLPGGDAGMALLFEGGGQGWNYAPDPRYLNGGAYLYTATAGSGHRSRYAGTFELRLPVMKMVTLDLSNRFDDYRVSGQSVSKDTYNLSVEFRPLRTLLLRGRYGTAFKAPTLSDEFQGTSGFFQSVTDYYTCTKEGYNPANPANISQCPQANQSVFGTTSGNPSLQPITAKVDDVGIVWSPVPQSSFGVDFLHWHITNEVQQQDSDQLLRTDSACLLGQLDPKSPTCVQAIAQVTRDSNGLITQISTPKINIAEETLNVLVFNFDYVLDAGASGTFTFSGAYSDLLKHSQVNFPGDAPIDLINNPFYSTDFRTKENLSVDWKFHRFGATVYAEGYGQTPNYIAQQTVVGYGAPGAGRVSAWTVANLSARYEVLPGLQISANINNLFDRMPPTDNTQPGYTNQPFNLF